jgi:hypothetical protein
MELRMMHGLRTESGQPPDSDEFGYGKEAAAGSRLRAVLSRVRRAAWPAGLSVAAVVLFLCALREARTLTVGSDSASIALQAWAMLHGNLLLTGWHLSDVSFYTTELPEYMLVESVRGLRPDVVHVSAALTYTLLVVLAALVAKGRRGDHAGAVADGRQRSALRPGPYRQCGAGAGGAVAAGVGRAALVRPAAYRGGAGLGGDRRPAGAGYRSGPGAGGVPVAGG